MNASTSIDNQLLNSLAQSALLAAFDLPYIIVNEAFECFVIEGEMQPYTHLNEPFAPGSKLWLHQLISPLQQHVKDIINRSAKSNKLEKSHLIKCLVAGEDQFVVAKAKPFKMANAPEPFKESLFVVTFERIEVENPVKNPQNLIVFTKKNDEDIEGEEHMLTDLKGQLTKCDHERDTLRRLLEETRSELDLVKEKLKTATSKLEAKSREIENEATLSTLNIRQPYEYLFDKNPVALFIWDFETKRIVDTNAAALELYGYTREEFLQLTIGEIRPVEDLEELELFVSKEETYANKAKEMHQRNWRHLKKSGELMYVQVAGHLIEYNGRKASMVLITDITQRTLAEENLRLSEENYRSLFHLSPSPIWVYALDDFQILDANESALNLFEYSHETLLAMTVEELPLVDKFSAITATHDDNQSQRGKMPLGIQHLVTESGRRFSIDVTGNKIFYKGKQCILAVGSDVTEKEQLLNILKQRNSFIENILQNLPIGIAVNKISDGQATMVNGNFSKIYGWTDNDLTDVPSFFKKVYPNENYRNEIMQMILADIASGDPEKMQWRNIKVTTSNGDVRYVNAKNIPLYDQDLMISTVLDVSAEARHAAEIARVKKNQEQMINSTDDLIWSVDTNYCLIATNQAYLNMMKMVTNKVFTEGDSVFVAEFGPELNQKWHDYYTRALSGEKFQINEKVYNPLSNSYQYGIVSFIPMIDDNGNMYGVACYSKNITDLKEQQFALESAKDELDKIMNSSLDIICTINENGEFVNVSDAAEAIWGYTKNELTGKRYFDYIEQDYQVKSEAAAAAIMKGEKMTNFENCYVRKDGSLVNMIWSARWDDAEKIMYCVARDATELKLAEEKIKESNTRYEFVTKATFDAIWDWDLASHTVFWGDNYGHLFGVVEGEDIANEKNLFGRLHAGEVVEILKSAKNAIAGTQSNWSREHQYKKADGTFAYVSNKAVIIRNETGRATRVIGAMQDITRRRHEEQRLKLMESVVVNATDSVLITEAEPIDAPGPRIVYVNEAFTTMTGYTAEETIGKTPRMLQGPNSDRGELDRLKKALANWETCEITTINYKKSGEQFWVNFTVIPVANDKGWFTHWIAIERDVTRQKTIELQKQLFAEISVAFNGHAQLVPSLREVMEKVALFGGNFLFAETWLTSDNHENGNGKSQLSLTAWYSANQNVDNFYRQTASYTTVGLGENLAARVSKERQFIMLTDLNDPGTFARHKEAIEAGIEAVVGIPITYNNALIGVVLAGIGSQPHSYEYYNYLFKDLETFLGAEIKRKKLEEGLQRIFDTAPDIICVAGMDGFFRKINPAACLLLEYSENELLTLPFIDLLHPDDKNKTAKELENLSDGNATIYFENRYITKSGKTVWLAWAATPVLEEQTVYAVAKNITEQKKLNELLSSASSMARIGSWEIDLANNTLFWSPTTRELHEVSSDYIPDMDAALLFYHEGESRDLIKKGVETAITNGTNWDVEAKIVTAKNNERWIRAIGQAEQRDGTVVRIYGSIQDIHQQKLNELALKSAFDERNTILESIGDAFFTVDTNWIVTYWNKQAEVLLGIQRQSIVDKYLWDVFANAIDTDFFVQYHKAVNTGIATTFEAFYDFQQKWFEVSAYPSSKGLSVYFKDVTMRRVAEQQIRESNDRLEKVTAATNDAIWDWNIATGTIYWGEGFKTNFGYDHLKDVSTINEWSTLVHNQDVDMVLSSLNAAIEDKNVTNWQYEYRYKKADGEYAYVNDRGFISRNHNGKAIRMVGAMSDITYRKNYETSLKNLNSSLDERAKQLAISNEELEQFAYVASHDLQEPLRMITSFLSQLSRKYDTVLDDKGRVYIKMAVDGAMRMRQIILDLLEFSRVGRLNADKEIIDLNELLADMKLLLGKAIEETGATINYQPLPKLQNYKAPLMQVFHNLISNAIKYASPDNASVVNISCLDKGLMWQFAINDNGIGIEEEYFEKIFVIFQRLHGPQDYSGTGMGLAIVKKIVENLGGKIWLQSTVGVGSTFYFTIDK